MIKARAHGFRAATIDHQHAHEVAGQWRSPERAARIEPLERRLMMARPVAGDPVPPGTIYYADYTMVDHGSHNQLPSFTGSYSMKADGSGKTPVSTKFLGDPSRLLHSGRWTLSAEAPPAREGIPTTYPNGLPRREIFATPLDGGTRVQLTDDPNVQPGRAFWSPDDSFISFSAVTWTKVAQGGNYPADGGEWLADADVFRADVSWGAQPTAGAPAAVMDVGERFSTAWIGGVGIRDVYPDVVQLDWSPPGTQLAYQRTTPVPGSYDVDSLHVTSFDVALNPTGTIDLGVGRQPAFSPNGTRIAYSAPSPDEPNLHALWSVSPNGSGVVRLTRTAQMSDSNPRWSPDGKQIAFSRYTLPKGYQPGLSDVMRMPATGGSPVNLTKDTEYAAAIGWCADVDATSATTATSSTSATSITLFSDEPVHKSDDVEGASLIDLVG